jgi:hypothetical protein
LQPTLLQTTTFPGTDSIDSELVRVTPLELEVSPAQIQPPALLKLDVQGYELEALKGCESLLDRFTYVYLEVSFLEFYAGQPPASELFEFLQHRGLMFKGVYNTVFDSRRISVQCDCLFERRRTN